jgi:hypothetical protein
MLCLIIVGQWCDFTVVNICAPSENDDEVMDIFYDELEFAFDKFYRYHMKIC